MVSVGTGVSMGVRKLRASVRRGGAEQSGLASLTELSFVNAAGDALVTVTLAGSLFLTVPTGEARSKVGMYLLITMVPFVLLAPVIGPVLDRFAYGRRTALAAICLARGMLAWQLAGAINERLQVYPLALGLLVLSRAFGVARSAVIPRVTPRSLTLVKVNSRISLVNIVAGSVVAPLGLAIAKIPLVGYPWVLRICAIVYMAGVLLAFNLPKHVDSAAGEKRAFVLKEILTHRDITGRLRRVLGGLPVALRASLVLRGLVGFLTFYLAFLLRTNGGNNLWLGGLAICAGVGSGLGVFIGGRLGRRRPEALLILSLLMAAGGCLGAAINYMKLTSLLAAFLVTMAGSMSKLGLDAIIQRDITEDTRNSAFARSETALQLAWVAGGAFGLVEIPGTLGFAVASAAVLLTMFVEVRALHRSRTAARTTLARTTLARTGMAHFDPGPPGKPLPHTQAFEAPVPADINPPTLVDPHPSTVPDKPDRDATARPETDPLASQPTIPQRSPYRRWERDLR
ncbi:MFS transporter [Frankia sp. Cppng1_Ct_nod]|uniref:MFS transporter n=1 Tax=Frankia sp. Cppng1_Ct_nod TaxID=2897162 RepID=UPI0010416FC9|nr:MFS transporter [Frankia sp. Cppng1_Ct_nod]